MSIKKDCLIFFVLSLFVLLLFVYFFNFVSSSVEKQEHDFAIWLSQNQKQYSFKNLNEAEDMYKLEMFIKKNIK